jgi:hypothetical protein
MGQNESKGFDKKDLRTLQNDPPQGGLEDHLQEPPP